MITSAIITEASLLFGDPSKTHILNATWLTLANRAQRELARMTDSIMSKVTADDLTAGTALYDISTGGILGAYDVLRIYSILLGSKSTQLWPATEKNMLSKYGREFRYDVATSRSVPVYFYRAENNQLGIYPIPNSESDSTTPVVVTFSHLPATTLVDATTPELDAIFHDDMSLYMAILACLLDDKEERASYLAGLFGISLQSNKKMFKDNRLDIDPQGIADMTSFDDSV